MTAPDLATRRAAVRAQQAAGTLPPGERTAAARLLVDSDDLGDVRLAETLALAAMAQDPAAKPIAAAAFDRLRLLAGQPQKFGTQSTGRDGKRVLWPVEPTTTDSERAKWGLPPLADLRRSTGP
ncbi:MAG: hypothetical protein WAT39_20230 [Planctomycetota bacterium]